MLSVSPIGWLATVALVLCLFALDLASSRWRGHAPRLRETIAWTAFYIGVAVLFGLWLGAISGWDAASQYFAGYAVEKSLSIDNLFVFVIVIAQFAVPIEQERQALTGGVGLALALRAVFILLGAALIHALSFMFVIFGAALLFTAIQMLRHRDQDPAVEDNRLVAALSRAFPVTTRYYGGKLFARVDGRLALTPMLLVLVAIGSTDLLFAFDSIPAVFGLTQSTYIVLCANAFALLGLRALYFLVTDVLAKLVYLSTGLAAILAFIAVKLVLHYAHSQESAIPEIGTGLSLLAIAAILTATALASVAASRRHPTLRAHAGAVSAHREPTAPDRQPTAPS
jgi:tellurite resistance protein TerC